MRFDDIRKKVFAGDRLSREEGILLLREADLLSLGELADLKKIFKVSVACLAVRCSQLGVLSKAAYAKLWRHLMALGWNGPASSEPNPLPAEVPQRMERLCFRAVSEGAVSESRAAELMKISVRELDRRLTAQCA